jgi:hypothetical protein
VIVSCLPWCWNVQVPVHSLQATEVWAMWMHFVAQWMQHGPDIWHLQNDGGMCDERRASSDFCC